MTKLQTILLAVLSAVIAGLIYKFVPDLKEVGAGFAALTLLLIGYAKQHPADARAIVAAQDGTEVVTKPNVVKLPNPSSGGPVVALLALGAALLLAGPARAESRPCPQLTICFPSYNLRLAPGAAVGWQLNLKTGDAAQGVALAGGSLTWDNGAFPSLGVGVYGGTSIDPDGARYQGSIVFDVLDWVGVGVGLQGFQVRDDEVTCPDGTIIPGEKRMVWQGLLSIVGKVTIGGTPRAFLAAAKGGGQ